MADQRQLQRYFRACFALRVRVAGSYWSFDRQSLANAAVMDRDAAIVYKQRFGELPSGFKFLTDVADGPMRGLYRGREQ
jgi:hypothetical protein